MSLRITQGILFANARQQIQRTTLGRLRQQEQVSTGLRVNRPSDDPAATLRILPLQDRLRRLDSSAKTIGFVRDGLDGGASFLGDAADALQRLRELTVQGANATTSASDRQTIASEVDQLLQRTLADANAQLDGRYLFGGTVTDRPPFALAGKYATYAGGPEAAAAQTAIGTPLQQGVAGDSVFLARSRKPTTFDGSTGAAPSGAGDSGVGFGQLDVTFAGVSIPAGTTGLAAGDGSTTALGDIDYVFAAGSPPTLSLAGGPPQAITGGVQSFTVGNGSDTISLDVTTPITPATGTLTSEALLSIDGGQSTVRVSDFSQTYGVHSASDGSVLNVDVGALARVGSETVKYEGTFDVFTSLIAVRDLLQNDAGLPDATVTQRLSGLLGDIDGALNAVLGGQQELGERSQAASVLGSRVDSLSLARQSTLSSVEDTDLSSAILQLSQLELSYRASLQTSAQAVQTTLLDYLR